MFLQHDAKSINAINVMDYCGQATIILMNGRFVLDKVEQIFSKWITYWYALMFMFTKAKGCISACLYHLQTFLKNSVCFVDEQINVFPITMDTIYDKDGRVIMNLYQKTR